MVCARICNSSLTSVRLLAIWEASIRLSANSRDAATAAMIITCSLCSSESSFLMRGIAHQLRQAQKFGTQLEARSLRRVQIDPEMDPVIQNFERDDTAVLAEPRHIAYGQYCCLQPLQNHPKLFALG